MALKYPRKVYLIFPFDDNGKVAGVYIGCSHNPVARMELHIREKPLPRKEQNELHRLMRDNGFLYGVVDEIPTYTEQYIEYDWVDYFKQNYGYRIFNSLKYGSGEADCSRIVSPKEILDQTRFKFQGSRI